MYREEFKPDWSCEMLAGCPPEDVLVPNEHLFYRMASQATTYTAEDFKSYADTDPQHDRGEKLPLTLGLSLIDSESKAKLNNVKDMRPLTLIHTLVYYDVPQIFVAVDATGTNYLYIVSERCEEWLSLYGGADFPASTDGIHRRSA